LPETLPVIEGFTKDAVSVQIVSGAHLAAYSMGTEALSPGVEQPGYVVASHFHPAPRLRMSGVVPPLSLVDSHNKTN